MNSIYEGMANIWSNIILRIKSFFSKTNPTLKEKVLDCRLAELNRVKKSTSHTIITVPDKVVPIEVSSISVLSFSYFVSKELSSIPSMSSLWKKREEIELQRIKEIEASVSSTLSLIQIDLSNEDVHRASEQLGLIAGCIRGIRDASLVKLYEETNESLENLKEELYQREIRLEQERQRQTIEYIRKKKEREEIERKRIEQEEAERRQKAREEEERLKAKTLARLDELERLKDLSNRKSEDAESIANYLHEHGVNCFYHFTHERNVSRIRKQGGLYSWEYAENHDIDVYDYGGDADSRNYDKRYNLQDYVRLSFCKDHPMTYRKKKEGNTLVLLTIDVQIAQIEGVMFSTENAASSSHEHGIGLEALKKVDINATQQTYVSREDPNFSKHQAECMVKTFIPLEYITNINKPRYI